MVQYMIYIVYSMLCEDNDFMKIFPQAHLLTVEAVELGD